MAIQEDPKHQIPQSLGRPEAASLNDLLCEVHPRLSSQRDWKVPTLAMEMGMLKETMEKAIHVCALESLSRGAQEVTTPCCKQEYPLQTPVSLALPSDFRVLEHAIALACHDSLLHSETASECVCVEVLCPFCAKDLVMPSKDLALPHLEGYLHPPASLCAVLGCGSWQVEKLLDYLTDLGRLFAHWSSALSLEWSFLPRVMQQP